MRGLFGFRARRVWLAALRRFDNCIRHSSASPNRYCKVAAGKNRSDGFELEISGEVLPG
jgi:outer membrane receptor for ferric coprogen and ferric-rhodotorulic acid